MASVWSDQLGQIYRLSSWCVSRLCILQVFVIACMVGGKARLVGKQGCLCTVRTDYQRRCVNARLPFGLFSTIREASEKQTPTPTPAAAAATVVWAWLPQRWHAVWYSTVGKGNFLCLSVILVNYVISPIQSEDNLFSRGDFLQSPSQLSLLVRSGGLVTGCSDCKCTAHAQQMHGTLPLDSRRKYKLQELTA